MCLVEKHKKKVTPSRGRVGGTQAGGEVATRLCWHTNWELFTSDWLPQLAQGFLFTLKAFLPFGSILSPPLTVEVSLLHPLIQSTIQDFLDSWTFYPMTLTRLAFEADPVFQKGQVIVTQPLAFPFPASVKLLFCHQYRALICYYSMPAYLPISIFVTVSIIKWDVASN